MRFEILNVEHGFAAYAIAKDRSVFLFDCGHSATCKPSGYLWAQGIRVIRRLFVTNYLRRSRTITPCSQIPTT